MGLFKKKVLVQTYDKENKKPVIKSSICNGEQVAGFMDIRTGKHGIRSIAFPSIATGVYRFPVDLAAKIAVDTVSRFLDEHKDDFDLVEWVLFDEHTKSVYEAVIK